MLIVCDFDTKFTYVLADKKRSAYDRRVLSNAIKTKGFQCLIGKYCLRDIGYSNSDYYLVLYKGV